MSRDGFRPIFRRCPRWLLVVFISACLPVFIVGAVLFGVLQGYRFWAEELRMVINE